MNRSNPSLLIFLRVIRTKRHTLRNLPPLALIIQPFPIASPALAYNPGPRLAARRDLRRERHGVDDGAGAQLQRVRDDGLPRGSIDRRRDVEGPEHARDRQEQHPLGDVHALAEPPPPAEPEVVPLRRVRVRGRLGRRLEVVRVPGGVEDARVGISGGVVVDCPVA